MPHEWLWYFAILSCVTVIITIWDKIVAKRKRRRVPEAVLFALALLGGSPAMYVTMLLIRHKTLHKRFMLGLPAILAVQVLVYLALT